LLDRLVVDLRADVPVTDGAGALEVPGGRLRVLMVISRPAGRDDPHL
jgi:hypothetical protein